MFSESGHLSILFLVIAFWLLIIPVLDKGKTKHRSIVTLFAAVVGFRYMIWRLTETVIPFQGTSSEEIWIWGVFCVEVLAFIEIALFLLIMSRRNERSLEADQHQQNLTSFPSVDILIPTYNEERDVLEKTIIGAKNIHYPNFDVWVLDDGKRDWLRDYCLAKEVGYIRRPTNKHAKAGNINYALQQVQGDFFAIFDADFVPAHNFLERTIGFFLDDPQIGIVQTPQHFFNKDPIQTNLYIDKIFPDEQRLFFSEIAPCRDGWGAAFCCGSCSIARRSAIDIAGGIPTSSITEDLLTTLVLLRYGYKTIYLNEKLSQGLAPSSLEGYFIQRARWCRGGIQCMFVKEGPIRAKHLSLIQRILFLPYGWLLQPPTRIMVVLIPIVYLWFGITPLQMTTNAGIIDYLLPTILLYTLAMQWLVGSKYVPIISTAIGIFSAFRLLPVVISSVIKPFGEPFRVTPKGSADSIGVDTLTLSITLLFSAFTVGGIYLNLIPEYSILTDRQFFPFALLWAALNLVYLFISTLICFDIPRKRQEERFFTDETVKVSFADKQGMAKIIDISVGGMKLIANDLVPMNRGDQVIIEINGVGKVKAEVLNSRMYIMMKFHADDATRDKIIAKLFTGDYNNEVTGNIDKKNLFFKLFYRAFGHEMH